MRNANLAESATLNLRRELRSVARDAEALLKATAEIADDRVQDARERAAEALQRAQKTVSNGYVTEYARKAAYETGRYVRKHPWGVLGTVGALAGAGVIIGLLTRRDH
jgi:ElaB/YqjD/DUF883 family membrane-anchored ribosome-binding protein